MTKAERARMQRVYDHANTLMNAGPGDGRNVSNVELIEALIDDLGNMLNNKRPDNVSALYRRPTTKEA